MIKSKNSSAYIQIFFKKNDLIEYLGRTFMRPQGAALYQVRFIVQQMPYRGGSRTAPTAFVAFLTEPGIIALEGNVSSRLITLSPARLCGYVQLTKINNYRRASRNSRYVTIIKCLIADRSSPQKKGRSRNARPALPPLTTRTDS